MSRSTDPMTRRTRDAANAAAAVVVLFAGLWIATTQVHAIRDVSPFSEDPFDAVATYAAIFLPFVAGATWIRSLRHRGSLLPARTAARIRWGSTAAVVIVLTAAAADAVAIVGAGWPSGSGAVAGLVTGWVLIVIAASLGALVLLIRASATAANPSIEPGEPDVVDDGLALAIDIARLVRLHRPVGRLAAALERYLDRSPWSPRRHRVAFGVVLAVASGLSLSVWHIVREGPPPDLVAPVVFTTLGGIGVLAAYFATLVPLRLLRPPEP
jgi:hypothetical protein